MTNILGTELLQLDTTGRANVAEAVAIARKRCGELNALDKEVQQIIELYIELVILVQIRDGKWISMGITDAEQMGNPKAFLTVETDPLALKFKILLPAFARDVSMEIN